MWFLTACNSLDTPLGEGVLPLHRGVPSDYIKLQGDWKSNAYEWYLDHSLCYKLETIK